MHSRCVLVCLTLTTRQGIPGSSADRSTRAAPNHPGGSDDCSYLLLHHRSCLASSWSADWPPSYSYRGRIGFTLLRLTCSPPVSACPVTRAHVRLATC